MKNKEKQKLYFAVPDRNNAAANYCMNLDVIIGTSMKRIIIVY